jgi:hypothetical protein
LASAVVLYGIENAWPASVWGVEPAPPLIVWLDIPTTFTVPDTEAPDAGEVMVMVMSYPKKFKNS